MTAERTPGDVNFQAIGEANQYVMLDENGEWLMTILHNGQQVTAEQEANMRHMAACWNAFGGLDTEDIEERYGEWGVLETPEKAIAKLERAQQQLTAANEACTKRHLRVVEVMEQLREQVLIKLELLEALKSTLDLIEIHHHEPEVSEALTIIRAAIAKAEGGAV